MDITIHNVGHGACTTVTSSNGKKVMVDCGVSSNPIWRPSTHYAGQRFEALFISNFDEDHVSDLERLFSPPNGLIFPPSFSYVIANMTVSPQDLRTAKSGSGMGSGIERYINWLQNVGAPRGQLPDFGTMTVNWYWNNHPYNWDFQNLNNISLVTIFKEDEFKFVTCGDIESDGFLSLLQSNVGPQITDDIRNADVFVAPHHGRRNGYNSDVMALINPALVIFSDARIQHTTQETVNLYASHARGANVEFQPSQRYVLTTRRDGTISISSDRARWFVNVGC